MKFITLFTTVNAQVSIAGSKFYKDQSKSTKSVRSFDEKNIGPSQSSAFFDNLKPFLFYTVSIRIATSSGTGESITKQFKTPSTGKFAFVKLLFLIERALKSRDLLGAYCFHN